MRLHPTVDDMEDSFDSLSVASTSSPTKKKAKKFRSAYHDQERDVWVCKLCGWIYSTSQPNSRLRREHKKICAGRTQEQEEEPGSRPGVSDQSCVTTDHDLADSGYTAEPGLFRAGQRPTRSRQAEVDSHGAAADGMAGEPRPESENVGHGGTPPGPSSENNGPSAGSGSVQAQSERTGAAVTKAAKSRHRARTANGLADETDRIKSVDTPGAEEGGKGLRYILQRDGDESSRRRLSGADTEEFFDPCGEVDDDEEPGRNSVSEDMQLLSEDGLLEEMSQAAAAAGGGSSFVGRAMRTHVSPGFFYPPGGPASDDDDDRQDLTWLERCFGFLMPLVARRRAS